MKLFLIMKRYEDVSRRVNEFQQSIDITQNIHKVKSYVRLLLEQKHYAILLSKYSSSPVTIKAAQGVIRCIGNIITCAEAIKRIIGSTFVN